MSLTILRMRYVLYTHKPELTTMGKSLIHNESCWKQWLEESSNHGISVVEDISGVHADSTKEVAWSTVTTPDSSWTAPSRCVLPHFLVLQLCSPDWVSLPSTSLKRDFVVCSSSRKPEEDLLKFQEVMHHHPRNRSVSARDLVETLLQ